MRHSIHRSLEVEDPEILYSSNDLGFGGMLTKIESFRTYGEFPQLEALANINTKAKRENRACRNK